MEWGKVESPTPSRGAIGIWFLVGKSIFFSGVTTDILTTLGQDSHKAIVRQYKLDLMGEK